MKKVLQFSGIISLALAAVAFVLLLATPAMNYINGSTTVAFNGALVSFGGALDNTQKVILLTTGNAKLAIMGLLAFILGLLGLLIVCAGVVLPLLKVKGIEKFAGILNLCAVALLVVAGVFMFIVVPSFTSANGFDKVPESFHIGAGWVIGGILFIAGGAFAILPMIADFLGKKKRK